MKCPKCESPNYVYYTDSENKPIRYECEDCGHDWLPSWKVENAEAMLKRIREADETVPFTEVLKASLNYGYCEGVGSTDYVLMPYSTYLSIYNWAAIPIESAEEVYNDKDAMFEGLYLIWKLLEDSEQESLVVEKDHPFTGEKRVWNIPQITKHQSSGETPT